MANGQYINNNGFQNLIQQVIDYCNSINSLGKKYSDNFSTIKNKIINNKLKIDFIKSLDKTPIIEKIQYFQKKTKTRTHF